MGRTTRWLRSLFSASRKPRPKTRGALPNSADAHLDANKHAIAVAAATAAVAEAALAAAQAAAEVVRLTSAGGSNTRNDAAAPYVSANRRRAASAVRIQSAFRAYLARRALRALKGLVKLQALVRGHIVRKQSADMLRRMQAMARIQARASVHRAEPVKFEYPHHPGAVNQRNYHQHRNNNSKQGGSMLKQYTPSPRPWNSKSLKTESSHQPSNWLHHWMDVHARNDRRIDDDQTDKILEIDTWKPHQPSQRNDRMTIPPQYSSAWNDMARHTTKLQKPNPSIYSEEVSSMISPKGDQRAAYTAENSPRVHSASSKPTRGPFTPTRSDCNRSLYADYVSHPNYMSNTESSRAKVRSQSAPRQRMQMEDLGMSQGDASSEKGFDLPDNYRGTPYLPHPGHLRRQGTPARGAYTGPGSTYGQRL